MNVVGVLLAAGISSRFGRDKRRAKLADGTLLLKQSLDNLAPMVDSVVIAVQRHEAWLEVMIQPMAAVHCVSIPNTKGLGDTLAGVIDYVDKEGAADAVIVALGDMPWVKPQTLQAIRQALEVAHLIVPSFNHSWGHPVGFGRCYFEQLQT